MIYFSLVIDGQLVDLFQDESIQLNRQIKDYSKIDTVFTDFSQNFTIPATESNNKIFQNYFDENVLLQSWNQNFALSGQIYIHGLPVFDGEIEMLEVKFIDGLPSSYNIVFYGQSKSLIVNWGEKTLPEISWSAYSHTISNAAVISSWTGGILGGSIIWDIKDYGYGFRYCQNTSGGPSYNLNTYNTLTYKNLRPSILLKDMINNIFTAEGFTLGGSLLSRPEFDYLYVTPMECAGSYFDRINGQNYGQFTANDSSPQNIFKPTTTTATWFALPVGNTVVTGNISGAWNTSTYTYTCPETFDPYGFSINITNYTPLVAPSFTPRLGVKVTVNGKTKGFYQNKTAAQWTSGGPQTCYLSRLSKGDVVQFIYNTPVDAVVDGEIACIYSAPTSQVLVDMARVMPEIKISEFFNSVLQMFNAVLVPTSNTSFELHNIEDWYDNGINVEYTEFIDFKNITHRKMPVPSSISMKHKEGEALPQTFFKTTYKRNFGNVTFRPDVDFSDEPIEFESVFQVNPITLVREVDSSGNLISNTNIEMPFIINSESQGVDQKLILFYNGRNTNLKTLTNYSFYLGTTLITSYPPSSAFSGYATNSYSVAFGLEAPLTGNMPKNTMYWMYWNKYLSRLYSSRSRIVVVDAVIPVGVWLNMKLNDNVAISGNYYKIQKIQYDLLSQKAVIELIAYPNVNIMEITTTVGKKPTFSTVVATDAGKTFIDGNPIRKALGNAIEGGGIYVTDAVEIETFNISAQQMITPIMDNLLPLISLNKISMWTYTSTPITVSPTPIHIDMTDIGFEGDQSFYTYVLTNSEITIMNSGQYRIIVTLIVKNSSSAKVGFEVNIDGIQTEGYQEVHSNGIMNINMYASATIGQNQVVYLRAYTLDGSTKNIDIERCTFSIERIN